MVEWFRRVGRALAWVFRLEPVVVMGVVRAVLVVLAAAWALFGFELDTTVVEPRIAAVVAGLYLLAEALGAAWARARATASAKVVEYIANPRALEEVGVARVLAGPASNVQTGRDIGALTKGPDPTA